MYDARNLFQVNVEEGPAPVGHGYPLHSHFGRDGGRKRRSCWSDARET
jgi:hypothetical protein